MKESIINAIENVAEISKERLFSPMYFYFVIAWVITNWPFVYTLLFTSESEFEFENNY